MDSNTNINTSIHKLNVQEKQVYIKLFRKNSKDNLIDLTLYDGSNGWSGKYSFEKPEDVIENQEEYNKIVKGGLTGKRKDFDFYLEYVPGERKASFSWVRNFGNVKMKYGSVDLALDVETTKYSLIDFLLNENEELRNLIETNDRKNFNLMNKVEQCQCELEEFVNTKSSLESTLYGKFVQLLNEKKERIRLLEDNIQKYE